MEKNTITVAVTVNAPLSKTWETWTSPEHIVNWNNASSDWHTPFAENDLVEGGRFKSTMAAKDGSMSFDFEGTYTKVEVHQLIEYTLDDKREVKITFESLGDSTRVTESFDAESSHSTEMQKDGWQAILDNFKAYTESL
jgi:uncharacterized protein YndB with AHSA1/START domain